MSGRFVFYRTTQSSKHVLAWFRLCQLLTLYMLLLMHAAVVVNKDGRLDQCAGLIGSIIDAEKSRVSRALAEH